MAAGRSGPRAGQRLPGLLAILGLVATAAWVLPVVLSRGHGFDVSDEGSYVLSYRWWDTNARNFTGAQYIYGPTFEALGYSIPGLRLVRLTSVLIVHAVFGWAFTTWLRARFPSAVPSRAWVVAGAMALVAAGGATYGWLPLSPGYNDVVALGCLAVMAVFFRSWRSVLLTGRLPVGPALALPLPVLAMVLAKWSSAVVVLFFLGVVFVVVSRALRPAGWLRFLGSGLAGTAGVVLLFHLLVAPLEDVVPPMLEVNRLAAGTSHSAGALVDLYVRGTGEILGRVTTLLLLIVVLALAGAGVARTGARAAAGWVAAAGPLVVVGVVAAAGESPWPEGGGSGLADYSAGLVALVVATAVAFGAIAIRTDRGWARETGQADGVSAQDRRWDVPVVLATLLLLPVVQAVGSGNSLSSLAVNLAASWVALIMVCVAITAPASRVRWFAVSSAVATLVLCVSVGADGVLLHPYRTTAYDSSDRRLGGTGALASIAMSSTDRTELDAVRRAMAPTPPGRRPVVALDEIAGLVLLTEGRPLGEPWGSALAPDRLAAGIRAACRHDAWTGVEQPIVLAWRPVGAIVTDALEHCGVQMDSQTYWELRLPVDLRPVRILTPSR